MLNKINASLLAVAFTLATVTASADDAKRLSSTKEQLTNAVNSKNRPEEDIARDANRLPLETLLFFGFRDDMRVLDILPGGGYYTRILAPALAKKGELYLTIGTGYLADSLLKEKEYRHVKIVSEDTTVQRPEGARYYEMNKLNLDLKNLDMVTSFRAYHLFDDEDRAALNREVHKTLKPGGIYAVIDHTRRHGEPETEENRRRFDPVKAIKEIEAAGFDLVDYSDMHYRPVDDLTLEVGHESVTGQTDRWVLKFVKE